jgi:NADPH:quinone reductase-like Zn-dependent oxidoreductase
LMKVISVSLNYRDKLLVAGAYNRLMPLPMIPISDAAGEVVEAGRDVTRARVGDQIVAHYATKWIDGEPSEDRSLHTLGNTISGALAEYVVLDEQAIVSKPEYLTYDEAATLPVAALSAWYALIEMGRLKPSEFVLIQGTGGVSLFGLQFASAVGARPIVLSSSDRKLDKARGLGAVAGINYSRTPEWESTVLDLTEGRGVEHVLEVVGGNNLNRSLKILRPGGQISTVGMLESPNASLDLLTLFKKAAVIRGIGGAGHRRAFEEMTAAMSKFHLKPVIDSIYSFGDAPAAFGRLDQGPVGKVVVRIAD